MTLLGKKFLKKLMDAKEIDLDSLDQEKTKDTSGADFFDEKMGLDKDTFKDLSIKENRIELLKLAWQSVVKWNTQKFSQNNLNLNQRMYFELKGHFCITAKHNAIWNLATRKYFKQQPRIINFYEGD